MARRPQPVDRLWRVARRLCPALALALAAGPAPACVVCIDLPEETLTDRVWAAQTVALARNHPADPYAYQIIETLAGGPAAPVPFLVNTAERRRMADDPDRVALLLRGEDGWSLGGHGGADFAALARRVQAREAEWSDAADDPDRIRAFAGLHASADPVIRRLALSELARAPYARLRGIDVALSPEWLAARMGETAWYGWRPILVKLLGLHADPAAHDVVLARALDVPPADRVPWLVALIEVDGEEAIDRILAHRSGVPEARAAARALVMHADPSHALAPALAAALRRLALADPQIAAEAVPGLRALGDMSLAPAVASLLAEGRVGDGAGAFALKSYLAAARRSRAAEAEGHPQ